MPDPILSAKVRKFRKLLLDWYAEHGRDLPWRRPGEPIYRQVVTEILLQRTRAETVSRFYASFFRRYADWQDLAHASIVELEDALRPIGLWKERALTLKALAERVDTLGELPTEREALERLPGFGQYVTNAALMLRELEGAPLLDAGMARVLERVFGPRKLADIRYDPYLQDLACSVVEQPQSREINWAILDLAASNCSIGGPLCVSCPVVGVCRRLARADASRS